MEKAHHSLLVGERAGLDDGAAKHFDEAAAHGINGYAKQDAHQRIVEKTGHKGQASQAQGRCNLRNDDAPAVVYVLEFRAEEIRNQLNHIENGRNEGQAGYGNFILTVKSHEQKRRKIGHDGLRHKPQITRQFGFSIVFHSILISLAKLSILLLFVYNKINCP